MFVEFSVGNFRSFREPVTLSMLASKRKSRNRMVDEDAVFIVSDDISLLKCATVYGANGSGKSNLIAAIKFFRNFILNSSKESQTDEEIGVVPFRLSNEFSSNPSSFSISFIIDRTVYRYNIEVSSEEVVRESLKAYEVNAGRESILFDRNFREIKVSKKFPEGNGLEIKTRENALFLSVCANFAGEISKKILRWFRKVQVISGLDDFSTLRYTMSLLSKDKSKAQIMQILDAFDLGIDDFRVDESPINITFSKDLPVQLKPVFDELRKLNENQNATEMKLSSIHTVFGKNGEPLGKVSFSFLKDESEGTKKIVALAGPIYDSINNSLILFIDELDARLHSHMGKNFIKIFNSAATNIHNAQLIAITHDTNLLDNNLLRRDQIWFMEKDKQQASRLHSMIEYKVRNNAIFQREYDAGKFGAIPYVGDNRTAFCQSLIEPSSNESKSPEEK